MGRERRHLPPAIQTLNRADQRKHAPVVFQQDYAAWVRDSSLGVLVRGKWLGVGVRIEGLWLRGDVFRAQYSVFNVYFSLFSIQCSGCSFQYSGLGVLCSVFRFQREAFKNLLGSLWKEVQDSG